MRNKTFCRLDILKEPIGLGLKLEKKFHPSVQPATTQNMVKGILLHFLLEFRHKIELVYPLVHVSSRISGQINEQITSKCRSGASAAQIPVALGHRCAVSLHQLHLERVLPVEGRAAVLLRTRPRVRAVQENRAAVLAHRRVRIVVEYVVGEDEVALTPELEAVVAELVEPAVLAQCRVHDHVGVWLLAVVVHGVGVEEAAVLSVAGVGLGEGRG
jgi:hypothetical protein